MSVPATTYRFTFEPSSGRVQFVLDGTVIADSTRAMVMRETRLLPVLYVPLEDARMDLASKTEHHTYCPFKGNATYWSFNLNEKHFPNLMWSYEEPFDDASQLQGYAAFYTDQLEVVEQGSHEAQKTSTRGEYANPLIAWLMREAPMLSTGRELTAQLAEQMLANGVALWRLAVVIRTLHPQVVSYGYRWRLDSPDIEESQATYLTLTTPEFQNSPLLPIFEGAGGIRRRLEGPRPILDFGILEDLRREGATDYVAMPMVFLDGKINALTITSDRPGGFSTTDLGHLYEILDNLARLFEVHAARRKARSLLDTYLGPHAGARVLNGQIKRGDGDNIRAVIWFCDLRESTPLAASMTREAFLGLLNEYFDGMAGAVMAHGGEVLRFIGDAALAIFPISDDSTGQVTSSSEFSARRNALDAAIDAKRRMEIVNTQREADGRPPLRFGIALHEGEVTYGNIGTQDRLEFTVVGEAANRAARIEGMCKQLNESLLLSSEFSQHFSDIVRSVGSHRLRGVHEAVELFALREDGVAKTA